MPVSYMAAAIVAVLVFLLAVAWARRRRVQGEGKAEQPTEVEPGVKRLRIDFIMLDTKIVDEEKRIISFRLVPDPTLWKPVEKGYLNERESLLLTHKALADATRKMEGLPIHFHEIQKVPYDVLVTSVRQKIEDRRGRTS